MNNDNTHLRFLLTLIHITMQKMLVVLPKKSKYSLDEKLALKEVIKQEKEVFKEYKKYIKNEEDFVKDPFGTFFKNTNIK